jgi:hypothetical protein
MTVTCGPRPSGSGTSCRSDDRRAEARRSVFWSLRRRAPAIRPACLRAPHCSAPRDWRLGRGPRVALPDRAGAIRWGFLGMAGRARCADDARQPRRTCSHDHHPPVSPPTASCVSVTRPFAAPSARAASPPRSRKAMAPRPSACCRCGASCGAPTAARAPPPTCPANRSRPRMAGATTPPIATTTAPSACRTRRAMKPCGGTTQSTTSSPCWAGTTRRCSAGAGVRSSCMWRGRISRRRKAAWHCRNANCGGCSRRGFRRSTSRDDGGAAPEPPPG